MACILNNAKGLEPKMLFSPTEISQSDMPFTTMSRCY